MDREGLVARPPAVWETPTLEEIGLSAEVTAYMGVRED
ncbi:MAG TPA: pyrroloquinoline quinone precursor peptide PqqA [Acidimicrobiales bacterium]|jgi:coenzyme PQQ precursor peptide PqqA|nr:pyrroloquinoline quinone precursor peptide PqqA [Acidimicrobiales bacterium]